MEVFSSEKERKSWSDAIDSQTMSFDRVLELAELRKMILIHDNEENNGGMLHIVTEDGNTEDDNIEWCITYMESESWKEHHGDTTPERHEKQLLLAKELLKLTSYERKMVIGGNTMSEGVFDLLYNIDPSGIINQ